MCKNSDGFSACGIALYCIHFIGKDPGMAAFNAPADLFIKKNIGHGRKGKAIVLTILSLPEYYL
jgi:hypothetical protein